MTSADMNDANVSWTVQSGERMPDPYDKTILHTVTRDQLPDPEAQRAIGVDPDEWAAQGLVIIDEPAADEPTKKKAAK